jgi:ATP-dependent Clp protease protease subunit
MDIIQQKETINKKESNMYYKNPTIEDLFENLRNNRSEVKTFEDVVNHYAGWNRTLLVGDIDADLGGAIESFIRFYNLYDEEQNIPVDQRKPIKIYIDSNGGDLCATFTIIDAIRLSKTPVWTIVIGSAYSGGFFIAISGHKRIAYPLATYMYHEGSTANIGDAGKFRNFADFYDRQLDTLKDITLKYTNITEEQYKEHKKDDWWMDTKDAIEYGVCDEIAEAFV